MSRILICTEMRCGSRWMHYMLKDIYSLRPSPEIGRPRIMNEPNKVIANVESDWRQGRIPKLHGITPQELFALLPLETYDYRPIFMVRNPSDRGVSLAFHHKYQGYAGWVDLTDSEALNRIFLESDELYKTNQVIFDTMIPDYSTSRATEQSQFIWTSYEWLIDNTLDELVKIVEYIDAGEEYKLTRETIQRVIDAHSFEAKTGRKQGEELRRDTWRRKGIVGDSKNHLTDEMYMRVEEDLVRYNNLLKVSQNNT